MIVVDCVSNFAMLVALCDGRALLLGYDFRLGKEGLLRHLLLSGQFVSLLPCPLFPTMFVAVLGVVWAWARHRRCPSLIYVLLIRLGGCCGGKRRIWVWAGWNGVRFGLHWQDVLATLLCGYCFATLWHHGPSI